MSAAVAGRPDRRGKRNPDRRTVASGFLFGCGIAAAMIDLFVFHLVLQWHHFYDPPPPGWRSPPTASSTPSPGSSR